MNLFSRSILIVLSMLPVSVVSIAAKAKLTEIDHYENTRFSGSKEARHARRLLWEPGHTNMSFEDMYENLRQRAGIVDEIELESEFFRNLEILIQEEIIQVSGMCASSAPSAW